MAKEPTEKQLQTAARKQLYKESTGQDVTNSSSYQLSDSQREAFLSGKTMADRQPAPDLSGTRGYLGGSGAGNKLYDYTGTNYDGNLRDETLTGDSTILDDFRANNQGSLDALGNSVVNFVGKTAVNVVGGLAGAIYGVGDAVKNQKWSGLWDNDLTTELDGMSDSIGEKFKVYKSSDYNDKFILNKIVSNPIMFADEFMDALSFTAAAVATEFITGGMASAYIAPKALSYLSKLSKGSRASEVVSALGAASKVNGAIKGAATAGKLTRQLATGAFWEASVEARHASHDVRDKMVNDYVEQNGLESKEQIPEEVMADIQSRADKTGAYTMGLNLPLVGFSNLAQFPGIFGRGLNTTKKGLSKVGYDAATETAFNTTKSLSKNQRMLRKVWSAVENPLMEGFVEEGGQSVISKGAQLYFDRSNDLDAVDEADRFIKSSSKAFMDTYATQEGLNEVLMGAIIGGVGSPGMGALSIAGKNNAIGRLGFDIKTDENGNNTYKRKNIWEGGVVGGMREYQEEQEEADKIIKDINSNPSLVKAIKANYDFLIKAKTINEDMDEAVDKQDKFAFQNAKDDAMYNYVSSRMNAGLKDDVLSKIDDMDDMSEEEFYKAFKGDEEAIKSSDEDKATFKKRTVNTAREYANNIIKASNTVDNAYMGNNKELADQLKYTLSNSYNLDIRENNMKEELANLFTNLEGYVSMDLKKSTPESKSLISQIKSLEETLKNSEGNLDEDRVNSLKAQLSFYKDLMGKNTGIGELNFEAFNMMYFSKLSRPEQYDTNKSNIKGLLSDIVKIRERKNKFVGMYNTLISRKGQQEFVKLQEQLAELREKSAENQEKVAAAEEKVAVKNAKLDASKAKVAEKKGKPELAVTPDKQVSNDDILGLGFDFAPAAAADESLETGKSSAALAEEEEAEPVVAPVVEEEIPEVIPEEGDVEPVVGQGVTPPIIEPDTAEPVNTNEPEEPVEGTDEEPINPPEPLDNNTLEDQGIVPEYDGPEQTVSQQVHTVEMAIGATTLQEEAEVELPPSSEEETLEEVEVDVEDTWQEKENDPELSNEEESLDPTHTEPDEVFIPIELSENWFQGLQVANANTIGKAANPYPINPNHPSIVNSAYRLQAGETLTMKVLDLAEFNKLTGLNETANNFNTLLNDPEKMPIGLYTDEGEFVGFYMTTATVDSKSKHNKGGNASIVAANRTIRNNIFRVGALAEAFTINIREKTSGHNMYRKDANGKPIYEKASKVLTVGGKPALDIDIVISKNNLLTTLDNTPYKGVLKNPNNINGHVYIVNKAPDGSLIKHNVRVPKITKEDAIAIAELIRLRTANPRFAHMDPSQANALQRKAALKKDIDVDNPADWLSNISKIMHVNRNNIKFVKGPSLTDPDADVTYLYINLGKGKVFNAPLLQTMNNVRELLNFLSKNAHKGIRASFGELDVYKHPIYKNGKIEMVEYTNYKEYVLDNIETDLQAVTIDPVTREVYVQRDPMVILANNTFSVKAPNATVEAAVEAPSADVESAAENIGSVIDQIDFDDDFNFDSGSYREQLIDTTIEEEIDEMIKYCK